VLPEGLDKLIKFKYLIRSGTRDLPDFSIVPEQRRYRVPPPLMTVIINMSVKNGSEVVPVLNEALCHEDQLLNSGDGLRLVISLTTQPIHTNNTN
jgi:hypothetical protein